MRVYFDVLTGEELFSDAFVVREKAVVYKVESRWQVRTASDDLAGLRDEQAAQDPDSVTVNEVVDKFDFQAVRYKRMEFITLLKKYIQKVKAHLREQGLSQELDDFRRFAPVFVKKIMSDYRNWQFYKTQAEENGMIVLQKYGKDGITPYLYFWRHGCVERRF